MRAETFIKKIAREAGDATVKLFGKIGTEYMKSENLWDGVTKADLLSEKIVISGIKKHFPWHGIIAEESGRVRASADFVWIVDPIDGTLNFSKHIPMFGTMVALARKGRVVLAAVYLPIMKEFYFAKRQHGAFLNGKRIRCSANRDFNRSSGFLQFSMSETNIAIFRRIFAKKGKRHILAGSFGSMSVNASYVAAGRRDWMIAAHGAVHDFAAPSLLLTEAGCTITTLKGKPWTLNDTGFIAANPRLHTELVKLTKNI